MPNEDEARTDEDLLKATEDPEAPWCLIDEWEDEDFGLVRLEETDGAHVLFSVGFCPPDPAITEKQRFEIMARRMEQQHCHRIAGMASAPSPTAEWDRLREETTAGSPSNAEPRADDGFDYWARKVRQELEERKDETALIVRLGLDGGNYALKTTEQEAQYVVTEMRVIGE